MFLAIAVDNLATAQEMTADQEEAEALAREQKEKSAAKEATMFLPNPLMAPVPGQSEGAAGDPAAANKPGAAKSGTAAKPGTAAAGAGGAAKPGQQANKPGTNPPTTSTPAPPAITAQPTQPIRPGAKAKANSSLDVDKMITRKVDLDYIPGLDDDLKVILPGNLNLKYFQK